MDMIDNKLDHAKTKANEERTIVAVRERMGSESALSIVTIHCWTFAQGLPTKSVSILH